MLSVHTDVRVLVIEMREKERERERERERLKTTFRPLGFFKLFSVPIVVS